MATTQQFHLDARAAHCRKRLDKQSQIGPTRLARHALGPHQQPQASARFGRELPTSQRSTLQGFGPAQHGSDCRRTQGLIQGPIEIGMARGANHDQILQTNPPGGRRRRIKAPRTIDYHDSAAVATRLACRDQRQRRRAAPCGPQPFHERPATKSSCRQNPIQGLATTGDAIVLRPRNRGLNSLLKRANQLSTTTRIRAHASKCTNEHVHVKRNRKDLIETKKRKRDLTPTIAPLHGHPISVNFARLLDIHSAAWNLATDLDGLTYAQELARILVPPESHNSRENFIQKSSAPSSSHHSYLHQDSPKSATRIEQLLYSREPKSPRVLGALNDEMRF